jgi:hypothetical protein
MAKKDFSKAREPIEFTIDPDTFTAYDTIPADDLIDAAVKLQELAGADTKAQYGAYRELLELTLEPVSYQRFVARLSSKTNGIDLQQLDDVSGWLFEQYGLRPTPPSGNSSDGPPAPGSGTSSTGSTPPLELISVSSPSTAS